MSFEDSRKNVDYDPKKQERYDKNGHVLKRIIQAVALCTQQKARNVWQKCSWTKTYHTGC